MNCIADIQHIYYINLDERLDRKYHVKQQLQNIGIENAIRWRAVKMTNGALGCSLSHLSLLEMAKDRDLPHILIVEDDILFTRPEQFVQQCNAFLEKHGSEFDVALIAGNNIPPYEKVDDCCVKVMHCQTTTGYLVRNHYYDTLIDNYRTGIRNLIQTPYQHALYAIDKYWFRLQAVDTWYLIIPLTVTQKEDYSDIEKRFTNYSRVMLDLDKPWLMTSVSSASSATSSSGASIESCATTRR